MELDENKNKRRVSSKTRLGLDGDGRALLFANTFKFEWDEGEKSLQKMAEPCELELLT